MGAMPTLASPFTPGIPQDSGSHAPCHVQYCGMYLYSRTPHHHPHMSMQCGSEKIHSNTEFAALLWPVDARLSCRLVVVSLLRIDRYPAVILLAHRMRQTTNHASQSSKTAGKSSRGGSIFCAASSVEPCRSDHPLHHAQSRWPRDGMRMTEKGKRGRWNTNRKFHADAGWD